MVNFKQISSGVDTNFSTKLNTSFQKSLVTGHLARIDQLRIMQDSAITEQGDKLDSERDIFTDSDGYNNTLDSTKLFAKYDSTDDYYTQHTISGPHIEITATTLTEASFAINDCQIFKIANNTWILHCTVGTDAVKRAKLIRTLFIDERIRTAATGVSALKTSVSRDVGKRYTYAYYNWNSGSGSGVGTYTANFSDTSNNTSCSIWCYLSNDGGTAGQIELPSGTIIASMGGSSTLDERGTDQEADEKNNPATIQFEYTATSASSPRSATMIAYILSNGAVGTFTQSGGAGTTGAKTDWFVTYGIPLFTLADYDFSTTFPSWSIQTNTLTSSGNNIDSIFITAQKEDDGTNLITYDVSSDNGSTWTEDLSLDTINDITSTLGNQLIVKFNLPGDTDIRFYGYSLSYGRVV